MRRWVLLVAASAVVMGGGGGVAELPGHHRRSHLRGHRRLTPGEAAGPVAGQRLRPMNHQPRSRSGPGAGTVAFMGARPAAICLVAAVSGIAWVWSWYTMYLEIHRWKQCQPIVSLQPRTADFRHYDPTQARPTAQNPLRVHRRCPSGFRRRRRHGHCPHAPKIVPRIKGRPWGQSERVLDVARLTPRRRRHRPLGSTSSNAVPWKPSRDRGPIAAGQDLTSFSLSFFCTRDNLTWHAIPVVRPTNNTSTGTASPRRTAHPTATTAAADPAAACCPVDHPQRTMSIMKARA